MPELNNKKHILGLLAGHKAVADRLYEDDPFQVRGALERLSQKINNP